MRLASWNVNGIRAVHNKNKFLPFVEEYQPDILCLQETKAMQGQAEIDLPDYEEYWNSATKKGYSGTAIFTKEKPLSIRNGLPPHIAKKYKLADEYGDTNAEGRVIAAEFKKFWVVTVYTPNAKPDQSRLVLRHKHWDPAFLAYCLELEQDKPVLFCGDLNVAHTPDDLARPKENEGETGFTKEEREGIDNIIAAGFTDTYRIAHSGNGTYTWWSNFNRAREKNIGWRIDYWFASKKLAKRVTASTVESHVTGSDHCPVVLDIDI